MTRVERGSRSGGSGLRRAARVAVVLVLTVLTGLVLAALAPLALGYSAHVVTSGSMTPRVNPGDVVVTAPVTAAELRTGQVLLIHDPEVPGGLLLHRLVSFDEAGRLVTRGDANQSDDSLHAAQSDVRGLAVMRVPWVGLPSLWRAHGRFGLLALTGAVLIAAAVFASRGGKRPVDDGADADPVGPPADDAEEPPPVRRVEETRPVPRSADPRGDAAPIRHASSSSVTASLSKTGAVRSPAVRSFARPGVRTIEEEHSAPSARYSLPPVPPAAGRPADHRGAPVRPAGPRLRPADDHSGCVDGGRFCGQPRR
jgi:signal peptidase I